MISPSLLWVLFQFSSEATITFSNVYLTYFKINQKYKIQQKYLLYKMSLLLKICY